ncbi:hypothetical protein, partial [Bifidobacterium choerinum]
MLRDIQLCRFPFQNREKQQHTNEPTARTGFPIKNRIRPVTIAAPRIIHLSVLRGNHPKFQNRTSAYVPPLSALRGSNIPVWGEYADPFPPFSNT